MHVSQALRCHTDQGSGEKLRIQELRYLDISLYHLSFQNTEQAMAKRPREDSITCQDEKLFTNSSSDGLLPLVPTTERAHTPKFVQLDEPAGVESVIQCDLLPHKPLAFSSYEDYNVHYQKEHVNRCIVCCRNFPSSHFLDLHHAENHDPINEARKAKGEKIYACLLEGCDKVCWSWQKRKRHMIDKHSFPQNYDFFIVNYGLDRRQSMLRPERRPNMSRPQKPRKEKVKVSDSDGGSMLSLQSKVGLPEEAELPQPEPENPIDFDISMNDFTDAMSALKFVPRSVQLGRVVLTQQ